MQPKFRVTRRRLLSAAAATLAAPRAARAQGLVPLKVGSASSSSDVAIFLADRKGYFREEGLSVEVITFTSAANMVAPLGSGQLDVGGGSASAGLYNAYARGIKLKIVADKASSQPGYTVNKLLIARKHVDSGRFKSWADLKGMKIAMNGVGISSWGTLYAALQRAGVGFPDISTVDLPFPDHWIALQNGAVDAGLTTEPSATVAVQRGAAVAFSGDDELVPRHTIAQLLYSEELGVKKRDAGLRFMRAYLRGARYYFGSLKDGRIAGPNADEVISVLTEMTPIKDANVYRSMTPNGIDPDGRMNIPSLEADFDLYKRLGLVQGDVRVSDVLDLSFVEQAIRDLGPYAGPKP